MTKCDSNAYISMIHSILVRKTYIMSTNTGTSSSIDTKLMILATLRYNIQYTKKGKPREIINRKEIVNIANELRSILKEAGTIQYTGNDYNTKLNDPYWYIDLLEYLAIRAGGVTGIKHLVDVIGIIEHLLKRVRALETVNISGLEQAINNYKPVADNQSLVSIELDKDLIRRFLHDHVSDIKYRGATLRLIRQHLEIFIMSQVAGCKDLADGCCIYGKRNPKYREYAHIVRKDGNEAVHNWTSIDNDLRDNTIRSTRSAIEKFTPFKNYLESVIL